MAILVGQAEALGVVRPGDVDAMESRRAFPAANQQRQRRCCPNPRRYSTVRRCCPNPRRYSTVRRCAYGLPVWHSPVLALSSLPSAGGVIAAALSSAAALDDGASGTSRWAHIVGAFLHVLELSHYRSQLARVHLDETHRWLEMPRPANVGVELQRDRARGIDLRVLTG